MDATEIEKHLTNAIKAMETIRDDLCDELADKLANESAFQGMVREYLNNTAGNLSNWNKLVSYGGAKSSSWANIERTFTGTLTDLRTFRAAVLDEAKDVTECTVGCEEAIEALK